MHGQNCPGGKATESRTHIVAEYALHMDELDVLKGEIWKVDGGGVESFDSPDSSEKAIAIPGDEMVATEGKSGRYVKVFL